MNATERTVLQAAAKELGRPEHEVDFDTNLSHLLGSDFTAKLLFRIEDALDTEFDVDDLSPEPTLRRLAGIADNKRLVPA